jgi:exopolysaccharide production protein ExoZ
MKQHRYFYGIDIIRFTSAFSVLSFHFAYLNEAASFVSIWPATWFGWIGCEIFFVISGFVIANSANGATPTRFLRSRIIRLYPAVWLCATITLLVRMPDNVLSSYVRSVALIPKGPWISSVYWTLAVEIAFYSLVFVLLCFRAFSWMNRAALALTICSASYLTIIALRIWPVSDHMNVFLLRHGCFFALGIWIWLSTIRPLSGWERAAAIGSLLPCVLEIYLVGTQFLPRQIVGPAWVLAPIVFWSVAVACIWWSSRSDSHFRPRTAAFVRTLGLMTYPLYLVHDELGHRFIETMISLGTNKWAALALGTLFVNFVSWIICVLWEPQVRTFLAVAFDQVTLSGTTARKA